MIDYVIVLSGVFRGYGEDEMLFFSVSPEFRPIAERKARCLTAGVDYSGVERQGLFLPLAPWDIRSTTSQGVSLPEMQGRVPSQRSSVRCGPQTQSNRSALRRVY